MAFSQPIRRFEEPKEIIAQRSFGDCAANGCPLPGTINQHGDDVCRYHLHANKFDWDAITVVLRRRLQELATLEALQKLTHGEKELSKSENVGTDRVPMRSGETVAQYTDRLNATFAKTIQGIIQDRQEERANREKAAIDNQTESPQTRFQSIFKTLHERYTGAK